MLLDSTVMIDLLRDKEPAKRFVLTLTAKPAASVVTLTELLAGARSKKEEAAIAGLRQWVRLLPVDEGIAERAGQFIKHFRASHGTDDFDALIAATAEHHGLPLATANIKHFPMFPKLKRVY